MKTFKVFLITLIVILTINVFSQNHLNSERPGKTLNAFNITKGSLQMESGFIYQSVNYGFGLDSYYSLPSVMFRYGLLNFLELRIENSFQIHNFPESYTAKGISDFNLGFKLNLNGNKVRKTAFAIIGNVSLPLDNSAVGNNKITAGLSLAVTHRWSDLLESSMNIGAVSDPNRILRLVYNFSTKLNLTENFLVFGEVLGETYEPEYSDSQTTFDYNFGVVYLFSHRFQIDAFVGSGNSDTTFSFNLGICWKVF